MLCGSSRRFQVKHLLFVAACFGCVLLGVRDGHAQCASDAECRHGRTCHDGKCDAPAKRTCSRDLDCTAPMICQDDVCSAPVIATPPAAPPAGPEVRTEKKPITGLIIAGSVVFGVGWLVGGAITVGIDAADGSVSEASAFTFIPLAGPWIVLGTESPSTGQASGLVAQGVLQIGGLAMLIVGATVRKDVEVSTAFLGDGDGERAPLRIFPTPIGRDGLGLSLRIGAL